MKNQLLILFFLTALFQKGYSQEVFYNWENHFGGTAADGSNGIATDQNNNVYTIGYFKESVDFNSSSGPNILSSAYENNAFIRKSDSEGNFLWVKQLGSDSNFASINTITIDNSGNIYLSGTFSGTVDFDMGSGYYTMTSNGIEEGYILKLNSNGDFFWAKQTGNAYTKTIVSTTTDSLNNLLLTGSFKVTVDFNYGSSSHFLTSNGNSDIFIQKLDSNGSLLWVKQLGTAGINEGSSIKTDAQNNIYVSGHFSDSTDFDPGPGMSNLMGATNDIFHVKLNENGQFIWAKMINCSSPLRPYCKDMVLDSLNNIYTIGVFSYTADFSPGVGNNSFTTNGGHDVFIQKLDSNGNFIWVKRVGTSYSERAYSISVRSNNSILATGEFFGTVDFDPNSGTQNHTSSGQYDSYLLSLDLQGNFQWVKQIGGADYEYRTRVATGTDNSVYLTGMFRGTTDLHPDSSKTVPQTSNGYTDIYVVKLGNCRPDTVIDTVESCLPYRWRDDLYYTSDNDTASFFINDTTKGCGTVYKLNLTLPPPIDPNVTISGNTISSIQQNSSYQWLDCSNNFSPINGETSSSFSATTSGSYAVEISVEFCTDTSDCVPIVISDIDELESRDFLVFPNPGSGNVTIVHGDAEHITIYSIEGQMIHSLPISNRTESSNLLLESGVYLIRAKTNSEIKTIKVIVK